MPQNSYINENTIIYISNQEVFMSLDKLIASTPKQLNIFIIEIISILFLYEF